MTAHSLLPASEDLLKPILYDVGKVRELLQEDKEEQKHHCEKKAGKEQPVLVTGDPINMAPLPGTKEWLAPKIIEHHQEPRSYVMACNGKKCWRSRKDLRLLTYSACDRSLYRIVSVSPTRFSR